MTLVKCSGLAPLVTQLMQESLDHPWVLVWIQINQSIETIWIVVSESIGQNRI